MSWALYQLALDPHIQQQLRSEIRGIDQTVTGPYTTDTYSSMPLLDAVIKVLRSTYATKGEVADTLCRNACASTRRCRM